MQQVLYNEGVDTDPNSTQCDTVAILLVDPGNGNVVATFQGILQIDGSLSISLPGTVVGYSYYIYLRHRKLT